MVSNVKPLGGAGRGRFDPSHAAIASSQVRGLVEEGGDIRDRASHQNPGGEAHGWTLAMLGSNVTNAGSFAVGGRASNVDPEGIHRRERSSGSGPCEY